MNPIRVLLVDDHTILRAGLRALLGNVPALEIVGEATSVKRRSSSSRTSVPMSSCATSACQVLGGLEVAEQVARDFPGTRTIILSMHSEKQYAVRAMQAGAVGYVLKDAVLPNWSLPFGRPPAADCT